METSQSSHQKKRAISIILHVLWHIKMSIWNISCCNVSFHSRLFETKRRLFAGCVFTKEDICSSDMFSRKYFKIYRAEKMSLTTTNLEEFQLQKYLLSL